MLRKLVLIIFVLQIVCLLSCVDMENPTGDNYVDTEEPYDKYVDPTIKVGATAPDFSLEKATGGWISLANYKNKNNVVLVFHKGST